MIRPTIHHAEHMHGILKQLIEARECRFTATVECGQQTWTELRIDKQHVTFHTTRHVSFESWFQAEIERDGAHCEYEADLMSVERDNWGGYRVSYEICGV